MDVMHPVHVPDWAIPTIDNHASAQVLRNFPVFSTHASEWPTAEKVGSKRLGYFANSDTGNRGKIRGNTMRHQFDRPTGPGQKGSKRVVGAVHPSGWNEIARYNRPRFQRHCLAVVHAV